VDAAGSVGVLLEKGFCWPVRMRDDICEREKVKSVAPALLQLAVKTGWEESC
jgi:hypothetical protein